MNCFRNIRKTGGKKTQSAFLLPDLYVGYTTDFTRAAGTDSDGGLQKSRYSSQKKEVPCVDSK